MTNQSSIKQSARALLEALDELDQAETADARFVWSQIIPVHRERLRYELNLLPGRPDASRRD